MVSAATIAEVLQGLYDGLLALPTQHYKQLDSDAWSRRADMSPEWAPRHLAAWFDLLDVVEVLPDGVRLSGVLTFACAYRPTDDSSSQARRLSATLHAVQYLSGWRGAQARVWGVGSAKVDRDAQWTSTSISFTLHLARS